MFIDADDGEQLEIKHCPCDASLIRIGDGKNPLASVGVNKVL